MRKAAVLLAAIQIMLGTAPFTESGSRSLAHVEADGVQLHHAHSEETCVACIAFKVFDDAGHRESVPVAALATIGSVFSAVDAYDRWLVSGPPRSRAPPPLLFG